MNKILQLNLWLSKRNDKQSKVEVNDLTFFMLLSAKMKDIICRMTFLEKRASRIHDCREKSNQ